MSEPDHSAVSWATKWNSFSESAQGTCCMCVRSMCTLAVRLGRPTYTLASKRRITASSKSSKRLVAASTTTWPTGDADDWSILYKMKKRCP